MFKKMETKPEPELFDDIKTLIEPAVFLPIPQCIRLEKLIHASGGKKRSPKRLGLHIKDTSEKALQRAIYLSSHSNLLFLDGKAEMVFWGDAEVPVSNNGKLPRGSCFDLVGKNSAGDCVLCELKTGESADSPLFAVLELLAYYLVFNRNKELCFHENSIAKISQWEDKEIIDTPTLIVAGDKPYWDKWGRREKHVAPLEKLHEKYRFSFFSISVSSKLFFSNQQHKKSALYTPCLGEACEWRERTIQRA